MAVTETAPVGSLLRTWRERRRLSQQQLSDLSEVSTRHLSRVETGRARPTSEMIIRLADWLDVPLRDRNQLLLAGGFAPRYGDRPLGHPSLAAVMSGLRALLDAHQPNPALLLDDYWEVVDANPAALDLLDGCAEDLLQPPVNVIRLCLDPRGLAPRIANRREWAAHLAHQLRHRAERTGDPRHLSLLAELEQHLGHRSAGGPEPGPVLTLRLITDDGIRSYVSTSAQLTTASDVTLAGLHLETSLSIDQAAPAQPPASPRSA